MQTVGREDVDFATWGPYANLDEAVVSCPSLPAPFDCSFSGGAKEYPKIAGNAGEVFVMVVTDFANQAQEIRSLPDWWYSDD
jgi:hypothetical protein